MKKKTITEVQKKAGIDLLLIVLVTTIAFFVYIARANAIMSLVKCNDFPVLSRLLLVAGVQFGLAGLGITIVCILRKEKFSGFGLRIKGIGAAILGTVICFLPYLGYIILSGQWEGYQPLSIFMTEPVLNSGFPVAVLGMAVIILVWGFFEGFNYAVISQKINTRYPSHYFFLNYGAIVGAIACLLMHPIHFTLLGAVDGITTFIAIYGMLLVKEKTGNAWGCVFAFCFIWNAL